MMSNLLLHPALPLLVGSILIFIVKIGQLEVKMKSVDTFAF